MENRQRLMAAVALAGLLAINAGFADEVVVAEALEATTIRIDDVNRDLAKEANTAAAEKAAQAVLADTKLDLDIRLIGPTSVKIAGDR
jgi:septum formation inhibitor MinC